MESEQEPVSSGVTQEPGGLSVRPAVNVFVRPSARSSTLAESTFRWWVDGWTDGQTFVMPQPMPCVLCGGVFSPLSEASPSPLPPSLLPSGCTACIATRGGHGGEALHANSVETSQLTTSSLRCRGRGGEENWWELEAVRV